MKKAFQKIIIGALAILFASILSCKKHGAESIQPVIKDTVVTTRWVGNYSIGNGPVNHAMTADINSDHTIKITQLGTPAPGTWSQSGKAILAHYAFNATSTGQYSLEAIVSDSGKTLSGSWGEQNTVKGGGLILLTKQ